MRKFTRIVRNLHKARSLYECQRISNVSAGDDLRGLATLPARIQLQSNIEYIGWMQQIRRCSAAPAIVKACWQCEKVSEMWNYLLCDECGTVQDLENDVNYFDLLNCERKFEVEPKQLTKTFRDLQTCVHPDKFLSRPLREQKNSYAWSSLINKAYKTLTVPVDRGEYLLKMKGIKIPRGTSSLDKEFLGEMMERHSEVAKAKTKQALLPLQKRVADDISEKVKELKEHFEANDLKKATATLVELKYLISIQNNTKQKLEKILNRS